MNQDIPITLVDDELFYKFYNGERFREEGVFIGAGIYSSVTDGYAYLYKVDDEMNTVNVLCPKSEYLNLDENDPPRAHFHMIVMNGKTLYKCIKCGQFSTRNLKCGRKKCGTF